MADYHTNSIEEPPKNREVYHNNENCSEGKKIQPKHREAGKGGKPLCKVC
jgi:formylmethanofuran dehydrogenase subunit E